MYDVVFKFMMEDERVAKAFLSAIIEEEVIELDFAAQEHTMRRLKTEKEKQDEKEATEQVAKKKTIEKDEKKDTDGETFFTVCRFDFSARIALPDGGFKVVLIELQKAKLSSDIMRFRRYLGLHYKDPNNSYKSEGDKKARQIYCIFLLGYDIGIPGHPIIQVDNMVKDGTTKESLSETNEFIEGLHHRSWIVQIDQLKQRRRNDVETLLSVFDQANRTKNRHIVNINEDDFPESFRPVIRRLRMASENEDIQIEMEMEDDYMEDLLEKERTIANQKKVIEEKDKALEEKDKALEELQRQLAEIQKQNQIK
jgi:hypothetical protein